MNEKSFEFGKDWESYDKKYPDMERINGGKRDHRLALWNYRLFGNLNG